MDPNDRGNWTSGRVGVGDLKGSKWGVSAASYPQLNIAALSLSDVQALFLRDYWSPIEGDLLPWPIALCVADDAYNHGVSRAIHTLQEALKVAPDGKMGRITLEAVKAANVRSTVVAVQTYRALEYASDPNERLYGLDWFRERVLGTALTALGV